MMCTDMFLRYLSGIHSAPRYESIVFRVEDRRPSDGRLHTFHIRVVFNCVPPRRDSRLLTTTYHHHWQPPTEGYLNYRAT